MFVILIVYRLFISPMDEKTKKEIVKIIINAILAVVTALCASSCTLLACGRTPFGGLL